MIVKAIQDFLARCPGMEMQPLGKIMTDMPKGEASSYALAPAGNGETKRDIAGGRSYRNNYLFYAKEAVQDEADRQVNYDFLESVMDWLEEQTDDGNYPKLSAPYEVTNITVSNGLLFDVDDGLGLYQIQIQVEISKRRA